MYEFNQSKKLMKPYVNNTCNFTFKRKQIGIIYVGAITAVTKRVTITLLLCNKTDLGNEVI